MKNGYVVVEYPDHPKAFDTGTGVMGVYEHVLIAEEEVIDRQIKAGEVVHHLDLNKSNNSPENLMVLENPMHGKLHGWLNKNTITPNDNYRERKSVGCIRCKCCERPINAEEIYCSVHCMNEDRTNSLYPTKDELERLVWEKPTTQVAELFGVSDTAIGKLCTKLGIEKPPRGYWAKKKHGKIT